MNTTVQQNENDNSTIVEIEEVQDLDENETDPEVIKAHNQKLVDANRQLFARAKKAEGFVKGKDGKWVKPSIPPQKPETKPADAIKNETSDLTSADVFVLAKADIHQDDLDTVIKFAKFEGVTVAEALGNDMLKTMLDKKAEARKVAEGTNTSPAKRSNAKVSDETLIENARKGQLPSNDDDLKRLTMLMRKR